MKNKDIISNALADFKTDLAKKYNSMGLKASGRWETDLETYYSDSVDKIKFGIKGSHYTDYLVNGRRPTQKDGDGSLKEIILKWINDKGIKPRESEMEKEVLAFLITRKIHRDGIAVPNQFNSGDLLSTITKETVREVVLKIGTNIGYELRSDVIKELKK